MSLVSILLTVYNNKDDIINAIESVINQTYVTWELIIIDDGSTDGLTDVLLPYIANNPKIFFYQNKYNKGRYVTLNDALNIAKGDYIAIIDSDDIYVSTKIEKQVAILDNNINIVATYSLSKRETLIRLAEHTIMYKKKIINEIGYYDSVKFAADAEFRDRIITVYGINAVAYLQEIFYYAKKRINSLTSNSSTGVTGDGRIVRLNYKKNYKIWHRSGNKLYMPYPLITRMFPINDTILLE